MGKPDLVQRSRDRRALRPAVARAVRREARLSLAEIAAALDVTEGTVSRWETGERQPRGPVAGRWKKLLARIEADLRRG
jgi:DNA-binding transcriptional regulator YiaG